MPTEEREQAECFLEFDNSQILVAVCWRILKDFSELISIVVQKANVPSEKKENLGVLYRNLLLNLRHKGALLSVYNSFVSICKSICCENSLCDLPLKWLNELILSLDSVNPLLSITRRSGGIPYLFQALIICEIDVLKNNSILQIIIPPLISIVLKSKNESKIHAINILRILFKNSLIGTELMNFSESVLCLCIKGFTNEDWSVRNGCLMLFSSLLIRIFGCNRQSSNRSINQISFNDFYQKFNLELIPLTLEELTKSTQNPLKTQCLHPSLFPILSLISRLSPSSNLIYSDVRHEFLNLILKCFWSPVFKLREIAASCVVSLIDSNEFYLNNFVYWLFNRPSYSNNWFHASLNVAVNLKNFKLLTSFHINIIEESIEKQKNISPLNVYLIQNTLHIYNCKFNLKADSEIGKKLLFLCIPLSSHYSCDIFSRHSNISLTIDELVNIFNSKCSNFCMSKCLDEIVRIEKKSLDLENSCNIDLTDIIFKTNSISLIPSVIRYLKHKFIQQQNLQNERSQSSMYSAENIFPFLLFTQNPRFQLRLGLKFQILSIVLQVGVLNLV